MNRWTITPLILCIAFAVSGCVDRQAQQQGKATQKIISDPTQVVSVLTVMPQSVSETLEITGAVTAGEDAQIGAKLSGKLLAVYVKDGDPVSAGQLVATQDTSTQQAQLRLALAGLSTANSQLSQAISNARIGPMKSATAVRQAEAQLKSAQASLQKLKNGAREEERIQVEWQVKQAKTNLDIAQKDVERKQTLFDQGAIPKTQLEQAQNAFASAQNSYNAALQNQAIQNKGARPEDIAVAQEAVRSAREAVQQAEDQKKLDVLLNDQVNSAQAAVQSARAQVDVAKQAIADSEIKAPFAGKIAGKPAQPGQIVGPGTTVARIIGSGGDYFDGDVPEDQIARIRTGSPVTIGLTALAGKQFSGHVAAINPLGSDVGRLFSVRISLDTFSPEIKPGMFARGSVTLNVIPNAIMIPTTAVVTYKDHPTVFVLNGTAAVKPLLVTTGLQKSDMIQITSGLAPGEKVVIQGQQALNDKSKVRVEVPKTASATTTARETLGS